MFADAVLSHRKYPNLIIYEFDNGMLHDMAVFIFSIILKARGFSRLCLIPSYRDTQKRSDCIDEKSMSTFTKSEILRILQ